MSDYRAITALLDIPLTAPKAMLADKGYDGDSVRETLLVRGTLPIIPSQGEPRSGAVRLYPLSRTEPRQTPVQPPQAIGPNRHALRQNIPVLRQLPNSRLSKVVAQRLCQQSLSLAAAQEIRVIPDIIVRFEVIAG